MSDDIEERARKRKEERERRQKELDDELAQWEADRQKRIEERKARRAELNNEPPATPTAAASPAPSPAPSTETSTRKKRTLTRQQTQKVVEENLAKWEKERTERLQEREREEAERKRALDEMIQKEEAERESRLEQRRREREEKRKQEEAEEEERKKAREARSAARKQELEDQLRKTDDEHAKRLAKRGLRRDSGASTNSPTASLRTSKDTTLTPPKEKPRTSSTSLSAPKPSAGRIMQTVPPPNWNRLSKEDIFSLSPSEVPFTDESDIRMRPDSEMLKEHFRSEGRISREAVKELLNRAQELFRKEKNVVDVKGPVNVIGDIHGQYYDMLHVLKRAGTPGVEKSYVFLGDYVDRGTFSCEVCLYLFSLKINHPARITMIRGNHETRAMAIYHNFEKEVKSKYGEEIFDLWQVVFDTLPLAAIVETPEMGRWFCCHGGLSPSFKTIDDINEMDRFQEPPDDGGLCDIIWSDPIANDQAPNQNFTRNRERSCSWVYGYNPIIDFLEDNQLSTIVRAHQVKELGYEEHKFSQAIDRKYPLVLTVFSAPNYCDSYQNSGAYLEILDDTYTFHQFTWQDHPYCFPDFNNGFRFSLPFVMENMAKFILDILELVDSQEDNEDKGDAEESRQLREKVQGAARSLLQLQRARQENQNKLHKLGDDEPPSLPQKSRQGFAAVARRVLKRQDSKFDAARHADEENERLHKDPEIAQKVELIRRRSSKLLIASAFIQNASAKKQLSESQSVL